MQTTTLEIDAAYRKWRSELHRPAHGRRTADQFAGFLIPSLRAGDRVLDIGCGPGSITLGLAGAAADLEVTGVDIDPLAIESCAELAQARSIPNVRFVCADATELPFEAGAFDVVYSCATLQHIEDPGAVLAEARRVLAPGGRIGIADADHGSSILWPEDAAVEGWFDLAERLRVADGGTPRIGRMLGQLLLAAGFSDVQVGVRVIPAFGVAATPQANAWARQLEAPEFRVRVAALGIGRDPECVAMAEACRRWGAEPGALWAGAWFEVTAVA